MRKRTLQIISWDFSNPFYKVQIPKQAHEQPKHNKN